MNVPCYLIDLPDQVTVASRSGVLFFNKRLFSSAEDVTNYLTELVDEQADGQTETWIPGTKELEDFLP